ncbi:low temperature requirement protein A [Nonomuraea sp. NBC_01738]|uniref:low temperature requirement protein A n=1 Tax=Nonomuraea sp. NBC_01738 TaxID=2976003 RepID=UPI002E10E1BE|nr:low temperature requirement protein A [Nonomuraea sp. NBC_01738]
MTESGERHASWLELFFDLVVVVAVVQLAHRMHKPSLSGALVTLMVFYAIWSVWISYTLYANVVADKARIRSVLVGMFGIAVMAAAVPGVANKLETVQDTRDFAFALAYVICRFAAGSTFSKAGTVITSWSTAQWGRGLVLGPWIVSLMTDPPLTYQLWFVGIVFDLVLSVVRSRRQDEIMAKIRRRELRKGGHEWVRRAELDPGHLNERLGLFVIIVLGEAVMQVVIGAADVPWDIDLAFVAVSGFALVVSLWWLTFRYGVVAFPESGNITFKPGAVLPAHFVMTAGITGLAAGLGVTAEHAGDDGLALGIVWVMCLGLALNFGASMVLGAANGADRRWTWCYAVPTTVLPLVIAVLGDDLAGWMLVTLLFLVALWRIRYRPAAAS